MINSFGPHYKLIFIWYFCNMLNKVKDNLVRKSTAGSWEQQFNQQQ